MNIKKGTEQEQFYHIMTFEIDQSMTEDQLEIKINKLWVKKEILEGILIYVAEKSNNN